MNVRHLLQDFYYRCFDQHLFSTISRTYPVLARSVVKLNYGNRPWDEFPVFQCVDKKDLIFFHIPKCGGTSVANALGKSQFRHLPASVWHFSNPKRMAESRSCAIVRNPAERLASILMHMKSSIFSTASERAIFEMHGIDETNVDRFLILLLRDKKFQRIIYRGTNVGRSGFSASQTDYLTFRGKLLVENVFSLDRISVFEDWLCEKVGLPIQIGRHNSSKRKLILRPTDELKEEMESSIKDDVRLYESLMEVGGIALENSPELNTVKSALSKF